MFQLSLATWPRSNNMSKGNIYGSIYYDSIYGLPHGSYELQNKLFWCHRVMPHGKQGLGA
jgi:hypothetical protein